MTYVPITGGSCNIPLALFDKVSLTLIITLVIVAHILIIVEVGSTVHYQKDLSIWIEICFGASMLISLVWFIHAIWF